MLKRMSNVVPKIRYLSLHQFKSPTFWGYNNSVLAMLIITLLLFYMPDPCQRSILNMLTELAMFGPLLKAKDLKLDIADSVNRFLSALNLYIKSVP